MKLNAAGKPSPGCALQAPREDTPGTAHRSTEPRQSGRTARGRRALGGHSVGARREHGATARTHQQNDTAARADEKNRVQWKTTKQPQKDVHILYIMCVTRQVILHSALGPPHIHVHAYMCCTYDMCEREGWGEMKGNHETKHNRAFPAERGQLPRTAGRG